jgi:RND superfamily putative drug exporter
MQAPNDDLAHAASADPLETLGRFGRFGRFVSIHHLLFASVWVVVIAAAGYLAVIDKKDLSNDFRVPNTDSQAAYDLLEDEFASRNGATAKVVFWSTDGKPLDSGDSASSIKETIEQNEKLDKVSSVSNPLSLDVQSLVKQVAGSLPSEVAQAAEQFAQDIPSPISADGNIAYSTVTYSVPITTLITENPINSEKTAGQYSNPWSDLDDALAPARERGLNVAIGDTYNAPTSWWANHADEVGLAIGALLLFLAFGSLFGAAMSGSGAYSRAGDQTGQKGLSHAKT